MYKGVIYPFFLSILVGCGSGGGSDVSDSDDRGISDPYIGVWERGCTVVDRMQPLNMIFSAYNSGDFPVFYWIEKLTITEEGIDFEWQYFTDDQCTVKDQFLEIINSLINIENVSGEIQNEIEMESKGGWMFSRYKVSDPFYAESLSMYVGLYHENDNLYKVDEGDEVPYPYFEVIEEDSAIPEDYTVNFNKIYSHVLN